MMTIADETWWARARQARDQLAAQFLEHPNVSMIDIGVDPQDEHGTPVLRVHLRRIDAARPDIPSDVDGVQVHVIHGGYEIQN
jgi:hypothetical protein